MIIMLQYNNKSINNTQLDKNAIFYYFLQKYINKLKYMIYKR